MKRVAAARSATATKSTGAVRTRAGTATWRSRILPLPQWSALACQALIAFLFALWGALHLHGYTYTSSSWIGHGWSDYDEGVYLVSARLLNHGYAMFSAVFSSQPPVFLTSLALFLRLFNDAGGAGYLYSLSCGLLTIVGVAWLSWETAGKWSAVLAIAVLAISPGFVISAHAVEAEAPMMAVASLSAAAAARYARTQGRLWLVLASLLLAVATLAKLLGIFSAVPLAISIVLAAQGEPRPGFIRRVKIDALIAAVLVGLPVAASFLLLAPKQQFDQVIRFHLQASKITGLADPAWDTYRTFLGWDPGLLALGACGLAVAVVQRNRLSAIQIGWLFTTVLSTARYYPLFIHHLTVNLPPLAAVAGCVLAASPQEKITHVRQLTAKILLIVSAGVYLVWLPSTVSHASDTFAKDVNSAKASQVAWLKAHSGPDDMVVTDNQVLAVAANRLTPPELVDTSTVREKSGYLSLQLLEASTSDPRVRAVLLTRALFSDKAYTAWLAHTFHQVSAPGVPGLLFTR